MEAAHIREMIGLKKRRLIHINILFLILVPSAMYASNYLSGFELLLLVTIIFWIIAAFLLFLYLSGRKVGLKSWLRHDELERWYQGYRKWKRNKIIEIGVITGLAVLLTVICIIGDFSSGGEDNGVILIGGWIGVNLGELLRIGWLSSEEKSDPSE